jgi:hypothetical protein
MSGALELESPFLPRRVRLTVKYVHKPAVRYAQIAADDRAARLLVLVSVSAMFFRGFFTGEAAPLFSTTPSSSSFRPSSFVSEEVSTTLRGLRRCGAIIINCSALCCRFLRCRDSTTVLSETNRHRHASTASLHPKFFGFLSGTLVARLEARQGA